MWTIGEEVQVEGCSHAKARVWWIDYEPGKPPCLAYSGFSEAGTMLLSKKKVIVLCRKCSQMSEVPTVNGLR